MNEKIDLGLDLGPLPLRVVAAPLDGAAFREFSGAPGAVSEAPLGTSLISRRALYDTRDEVTAMAIVVCGESRSRERTDDALKPLRDARAAALSAHAAVPVATNGIPVAGAALALSRREHEVVRRLVKEELGEAAREALVAATAAAASGAGAAVSAQAYPGRRTSNRIATKSAVAGAAASAAGAAAAAAVAAADDARVVAAEKRVEDAAAALATAERKQTSAEKALAAAEKAAEVALAAARRPGTRGGRFCAQIVFSFSTTCCTSRFI